MMTIRPATKFDAFGCLEIYRWYVENTAVTFEVDAPSPTQMVLRVANASSTHAWFVADDGTQIVGYAHAGTFQAKPGYQWATEVSVYVRQGHEHQGIGRALYDALLARLARRGFRRAVALVRVPNEASAALHRSLGFELAGTLTRVGWKLGEWHDVQYLQRDLGAGEDPPAKPN